MLCRMEGDLPAHITTPIYTRDPLVTVPGGAIIGRLEPHKRRGEEAAVARTLAGLGMPAAVPRTRWHRPARGRQLSRQADPDRGRLLHPALAATMRPGGTAGGGATAAGDRADRGAARALLDPHRRPIGMIAPDLALIDPLGLPWWFVDRLKELGIEPVPCVPSEEWDSSSLTLSPRRVLMCEGYPRTIERLATHDVDVVTVPYREVQKGGGGVHCSTTGAWRATRPAQPAISRDHARLGYASHHAYAPRRSCSFSFSLVPRHLRARLPAGIPISGPSSLPIPCPSKSSEFAQPRSVAVSDRLHRAP